MNPLKKTTKKRASGLIAGVLMISLLLILGSCNFVDEDPDPQPNPDPDFTLRPLDDAIWARKAIAYSGYRTGQSPGEKIYPSEAQILEDLNLLVAEGFGLIRLYDTSTHGQRTIKVIKDNSLDLKVMLGAYLYGADATYGSQNQAQIDEAVRLANENKDIVVAVSVGNEVLVDWSFVAVPPKDMVAYIRDVRGRITQPVTVNDNYAPYAMGSGYDTAQVWREVDFAAIHTYAYWDAGYNLWQWRQETVAEAERADAMMDAALAYAKANFTAVRSALDAAGIDIPIVIGETGWQSVPSATVGSAQYTAHPVNHARYFTDMMAWAYGAAGSSPGDGFTRPKGMFYFEAFDEPWKQADDNWGLWNVSREEKYVLSGSGYTDADAVYYNPPADAAKITADTFILHRDAEAADGEVASSNTWNAWENGTTASVATGETNPPEGATFAIITPTPKVWGWGMTLSVTDPVDLSDFEAAGTLNFSVKTDYPGKIEVGFFTGNTSDQMGVDVYLTIDPASNSYGYANDNAWHAVSIPISDIVPSAAPAYGQDASATINMEQVFATFVIADRYATTGNSAGATNSISLDNIRWEK